MNNSSCAVDSIRRLPDPENTNNYEQIPFAFVEELSSKNVFLRLPSDFSPLERMILQATGNLQRLLSAFYNVPSRVEIIYNNIIPYTDHQTVSKGVCNTTQTQFERKIRMYFDDKVAYDAESILLVKDQTVLELIEKHKYGLGQIFGHTHRTPDFVLHSVGRHGDAPGASFWRDYTLTIPDVLDCFIRETFVEGLVEPFSGSRSTGTIWYRASNDTSKQFIETNGQLSSEVQIIR
ncbi:uncharacterized protein BYT42DRAFT_613496 [Radiomyces spectabilis]|uniref:uncharacterized protein n=1 Tax=Radiomyces spectabilis TaxID=64574 RepID=UPI00221E6BCE|nr:uncharacterized protein BYT42DRAFT_613496 [Radiomyces spectabilis]KAI8379171.1 hypothetical protein BYT42DRAFT_613496 [Radiomyces spectabilis]